MTERLTKHEKMISSLVTLKSAQNNYDIAKIRMNTAVCMIDDPDTDNKLAYAEYEACQRNLALHEAVLLRMVSTFFSRKSYYRIVRAVERDGEK